jgi:hypothetical protein
MPPVLMYAPIHAGSIGTALQSSAIVSSARQPPLGRAARVPGFDVSFNFNLQFFRYQ